LLFPSSPHRKVRTELKALLANQGTSKYKLFPGSRWFGLPLWIADKFVDNLFRGTLLKLAERSLKPEIVHALELQNAGYLALRAFESGPRGFKLISTNWGSDIFWFQRFPKHLAKLKRLMGISDYYSAECSRDVTLAKELGFSGIALPVIPNAGGFSEELLTAPLVPTDQRRSIAVKGYQGWVGRALTALSAVERVADSLKGHTIEVYSANQKTIVEARALAKRTELEVVVYPKGALSHKQVLELFARSKIYVGLSESDGISTSLLEAMAMGAIPVQTSTACCDEWFQESGVAVRSIDSETVAQAILRALDLATEPANAEKNRSTIRQKASATKVSEIARTFYQVD
jgi:hypothetical protein